MNCRHTRAEHGRAVAAEDGGWVSTVDSLERVPLVRYIVMDDVFVIYRQTDVRPRGCGHEAARQQTPQPSGLAEIC